MLYFTLNHLSEQALFKFEVFKLNRMPDFFSRRK